MDTWVALCHDEDSLSREHECYRNMAKGVGLAATWEAFKQRNIGDDW